MSASTATQGVRRSLLIPSLDGFWEHQERPSNPQPFGSNWLFTPPPYICEVNTEEQTVKVLNPSKIFAASLDGYYVRDASHSPSTFSFPENYILPPLAAVTIYCCPGQLSEYELAALAEPKLFWRTMEGNLRRKTFLASEDAVVLCNAHDAEVAILSFTDTSVELRTPAARQAQLIALRKLTVALCYARIAFVGLASSHATSGPLTLVFWLLLAHAADIMSRWVAMRQRTPLDTMALCLATLGDRLATLCTLGALILSYPSSHSGLFGAMLFCDAASYWLQLSCHALTTVGNSRSLRPPTRREVEAELVGYMCSHYPSVITAITVGNELFLLALYLLSPTIHPMLFGGKGSSGPVGTFPEGSAVPGTVLVTAAAGPRMLWLKPLLAPLMLCCVVRQLANGVQILISLSRLSSGVLLESARRDFLGTPAAAAAAAAAADESYHNSRRASTHPYPTRRSTIDANGNGGGSADQNSSGGGSHSHHRRNAG